jgi:hypothetical protein
MRIEGWGFACPAGLGFFGVALLGAGSVVGLLGFWPFLDLLVDY